MFNRAVLALTLSLAASGAGGSSAQSPTLKSVMNDKVDSAQLLLRPIVMADFAAIDRYSDPLRRISFTEIASWQAQSDPEYLARASALVQAIRDIRQGASLRDIDQASRGYTALVSSCVQCHQLVRERRTISTTIK